MALAKRGFDETTEDATTVFDKTWLKKNLNSKK